MSQQLEIFAMDRPQEINTGIVAPADQGNSAIMKRDKSPMRYIMDQQFIRVRQDILKLRWAIEAAENVAKYDRWLLHNVYREVIRDPHLTSQWESRKMKVKEKPFKIQNKAGEEKPDLTKILEKEWFYDWIDAALDSKLWGFSMIEFGEWENEQFNPYRVQTTYNIKFYPPINVLIRDNVKPELGIVTQIPNAVTGIPFDDPKYSENMMFIGKPYDFGLLFKICKYILFKDNCVGNWSEWAEVFGMDTRVGKTTAQGDDRRNFIKAIQNFGANQYAVISPEYEESIEFTGTTRTDAYKVYSELIGYIDSQTSKLIWGQDVVTNNTGQVVGKTGENVANMYGAADSKFIETLVNTRLIPFLQTKGFQKFDGYEFKWDNTEKLSLGEQAIVDKAIADMGFTIDPKYITNRYGVPVEAKVEPEPMPPNQKNLKNFYGQV